MDGIDLILGGHDHHYTHSVESDVTILKSGSEFREFSTIDVKYYGPHSVSVLSRRAFLPNFRPKSNSLVILRWYLIFNVMNFTKGSNQIHRWRL